MIPNRTKYIRHVDTTITSLLSVGGSKIITEVDSSKQQKDYGLWGHYLGSNLVGLFHILENSLYFLQTLLSEKVIIIHIV